MKKVCFVFICIGLFFGMSSAYAAKDEGFKGGDTGFMFYTGLPIMGEGIVGGYTSLFRNLGVGIDYHVTSSLAIEADCTGCMIIRKLRTETSQMNIRSGQLLLYFTTPI